MPTELNRFTAELARLCRERVTDEKWLIAPSLRVGRQWLARIARAGTPAVNVRVKTLAGLALELAGPEMARQGLSYLAGVRAEVMFGQIFASLKSRGPAYLTRLDPTPGLIAGVAATVRDLRLSGLAAPDLPDRAFEAAPKAAEIRAILAEYEQRLAAEKLLDYPGALAAAARRLRDGALPDNAAVIMPRDLADGLKGLEAKLWAAVPAARRTVLATDPERPLGSDGGVTLFRAVGEANEVREVLRRIAAAGIPFDEAEIIHTDYDTYAPLIYELVSRLAPGGVDALPATFAEGLPVRYSRPGRALRGWLEWAREDYSQAVLARMIQDGLLKIDLPPDRDLGFHRLAAIFRALPIGSGAGRALAVLDERLAARQHSGPAGPAGLDWPDIEERIAALAALRALVSELLDFARPATGPGQTLAGAVAFLERRCRAAGRLDEYSLHALLRSARELALCLAEGDAGGLDPKEWLGRLAGGAAVAGQGPRPGCLFVSPLHAGGHSGRTHTFIVGLDDSRFPGTGAQDPLLLDRERRDLSPHLATAAGRLALRLRDFGRLLGRLRGHITLSYCARELTDDRELFPSPALIAAYRTLSGESNGTIEDMNAWLPAPAAFAPGDPGRALDLTEWWLWRLCGQAQVTDPDQFIASSFPHLGRGLIARRARESDLFTEYDGFVPEAGAECDPAGPDRVVSATMLEKLGACPLEYFFKYVLGLRPPEEYTRDAKVWLDHLEQGSLLHEVFHRFMGELGRKGLRPEAPRDLELMDGLLEQSIRKRISERPPPNPLVFEREQSTLRLIARIFLLEEQKHCRTHRPCYFEAAIGLPASEGPTPLDCREPARVPLPDGTVVRAAGRIDRIDERAGPAGTEFCIWDYKTGSAWKYQDDPKQKGSGPFWRGRCVQNAFYLALAGPRIRELHPNANLASFGYFFPGDRGRGERIEWTREVLEPGMNVIARLCAMLRRGCFPFSNLAEDGTGDYELAVGDTFAAARAAERKLKNARNEALAPFRELREIKAEDGPDE